MTEPARVPMPIPVTIIAGFLGSGKTTLLNRILQAQHGRRVAVLVNDFGQINIDTRLLQQDTTGQIISLPNGCICCTLARNLVSTVQELLRLPVPPERILIEASGVSTPENITAILDVPDLQRAIVLESTVTLLDAENVRRLARAVVFVESQISSADLILLNKVDLVTQAGLEEVTAWIREIAPDARIAATSYANIPLELILGSDDAASPVPETAARPARAGHEPLDHHEDHGLAYGTWSYTGTRPLARAPLLALLAGLPVSVYRAKGIVHLADAPDERHVLQVVGKRVQLESAGPWGEQTPATELVFIGEPAALDPDQLQADLDRCME